MKRACMASVLILAFTVPLALAQFGTSASKSPTLLRELSGQVMNRSDAPLPEAIVYLKNTKTLAIKTFIADDNGNYRFPGLSANVDYEVHAEYKGKKSDTKTLSSFDNRSKATINLKIDAAK